MILEIIKFAFPPLIPAMLCISLILKWFTLVSLIIPAFILSFLLIGDVSASSTYSSIYLVKLSYNTTSDAYKDLVTKSPSSNITITANYMAMCVSGANEKMCSPAGNTTSLENHTKVHLGKTTLSLSDVSRSVSDACHPRLLVVTIALTLLLLIMVIWCAVPFFPVKPVVRKISCGTALLTVLLWGLGAMLQHQTLEGALYFIKSASLGLISAKKGGRAEAMSWTAFTFLLLSFFMLAFTCFREQPKDKPPAPPSPEKV